MFAQAEPQVLCGHLIFLHICIAQRQEASDETVIWVALNNSEPPIQSLLEYFFLDCFVKAEK